MRTFRGLASWTATLLLLTQTGCAARGVRAPSVESTVMPAARDRETCEDLARTNAERPTGKSAGRAFVEVFFGTLFIPMVPGPNPLAPIFAAVSAIGVARDNAKTRDGLYRRTLEDCLKGTPDPVPPAETARGPEYE